MSQEGEQPVYKYEQVLEESTQYFRGDELAASVFFKYALQDDENNYIESNPDHMHERMASEFARIEKKFGGPNALDKQTIYGYFKDFRYICPQGSPMTGIGNEYQHVSLSNCFVIDSPEDTMSGIFNTGRDLANLSKRRGGVGLDISKLRPDGAGVSNSAKTSSGAWSFSDFYSNVGRMVGQNGRRAAIMITMDVRHPDIEKFITMKHDLTKVTGANVSIKLRDDFMQAVRDEKEYTLRWPIDSDNPKIIKTVDAKYIWSLIVESATKTAEPGALFWDTMLNNLPAQCYADVGFNHVSTNPCSELILSAGDSCRLISINLKHLVKDFFTEEAAFDFNKFKEVVSVAMRLSDDLVELELEKLQDLIKIADTDDEKSLFTKMYNSCKNGRRTGLGTHGLADALARLNIAYDSDDALNVIDKIYKTLRNEAYKTSVELAKERGSFSVFDWKKEKDNVFIKRLPKRVRVAIEKFGRRNISLLTNAPTGSVSIMSQTSSGLEPVFKNHHIRRKKRNQNEEVLDTDFVDQMGDHWVEFDVFHHNVSEWMELNPGKKLPPFFVESNNIDWRRRVEIQATMTKYIDHSISSTINLPKGTTLDVVEEIYMKSWELGCKGITVYVDGSRTGVLVSEYDKESLEYIDAPKRQEDLECDIHSVSVKGEKWVILVGLMDGKPYEVFGGLSENVEIPAKYKKGIITKASSNKTTANRYDLKLNGLKIKNITKMFDNPLYQVHTRMVSLGLRHGVRPSFLVEQLQKDPDNDLSSFSKVLARVLKRYIEDGTKVTSDKTCPSCGSESLIYQEGCRMCTNCPYSVCS